MPTLQADVSELSPKAFAPVTGLIASPPCPTFSTTGNGAGAHDMPHIVTCAHELAAGFDSRYQYTRLVNDERSLLTLEPLRWALALRPRWLAFEQVPPVLVLWRLFGELLTEAGYHVATGVLNAEQYGVPQTRKRAILIGSLDGPVSLPRPTCSKFYARNPDKLDSGVPSWVSMYDALGWGWGDFLLSNYNDGSTGTRGQRPATHPSFVVTTKYNRNFRVKLEGAKVRVTLAEAGTIQTFDAAHPWRGTGTKQFEQVGNAIPPLLAEHVLKAARVHV